MSNFLNTVSTIGALAMAATPLVAIGGFAHAADRQPVRIQVSDLDFARATDAATFRQRVDVVAQTMCGSDREIGARAACDSAVQDEAVQKLGSAQRQDLRSAETASRSAWHVASN